MSKPWFEAADGAFSMRWGEPEFVTFDFELLRTNREGELSAEVSAWVTPEGLSTHLHTARLNLTSTPARATLAKHLAARSQGHQPDWAGALEAACLRVIGAYRAGEPAILLRDAERPPDVGQLLPPLALGRLPSMLFGDGGSAKSLVALGVGASIHTGQPVIGLQPTGQRRVAYLDWEMDGWEHRERLRGLVGEDMPDLVYVACRRPLVEETDRIRRILRQRDIGYVIVDSVGLACDGPPEAAEVANRFFGALRQLDRGAFLVAHTTKADDSGDRPFGSTFWHNSSRLTWYVKKQQDTGSGGLTVGLFNRKANTGPLANPLGFAVRFDGDRISIGPADLGRVPELASRVPTRLRIASELRAGAHTIADLAESLEMSAEAIRKQLERNPEFRRLDDPSPGGITRWGLAA